MAGVILSKQFSNKTPIHRSASHMVLDCPICGISFTRKASEVKRNNVTYCSHACRGVGQRIQEQVSCRICAKMFWVKKSSVGKITCCGDECHRKALSESTTAMDIAGWKKGIFKVGEAHTAAKITATQAKAILRDNRSNAAIGRELGLTRAAVRAIKTRKTWKHLTGN